MLDRFNLANKIILLTGGAGLYGRGLTADLAAAGATLVVASRDLGACQRVAVDECQRGFTVHPASYDQGDEKSILALKDHILEKFGRMGNPGDLGGSVVFLLSDASNYITGINLPVDGGFSAH